MNWAHKEVGLVENVSRKWVSTAVKLDISKTYDRVEWCFLKKVMESMGFNEKWISLIMNCITTVSYSVLINGVAQDCITLQGVYAKETQYPHTYFSFVQKVLQV